MAPLIILYYPAFGAVEAILDEIGDTFGVEPINLALNDNFVIVESSLLEMAGISGLILP